MATLEDLKRKLKSAEDLQSIVKTMKALAAVRIREYERAVESLAEYNRSVELGLQVVLRRGPERPAPSASLEGERLGAVVLGSGLGMCGQFNEQLARYACERMRRSGVEQGDRVCFALGERIGARLENLGQPVAERYRVPGSLDAITRTAQEMLVRINQWYVDKDVSRVLLFHHRLRGSTSYRPHMVQLFPLDLDWLAELGSRRWPSRMIPMFTMRWRNLLAALVREYIFVCLYRALAESAASENASRLAAMEAAERNIRDRLRELEASFHHERQSAITSELLDIVSGFEALREEDEGAPL